MNILSTYNIYSYSYEFTLRWIEINFCPKHMQIFKTIKFLFYLTSLADSMKIGRCNDFHCIDAINNVGAILNKCDILYYIIFMALKAVIEPW